MGRFHGRGGELDAAADLLAEIAGDMPADQGADGFADGAVFDGAFDVGELGIETLRIPDGEQQALGASQGNQLVGLGQFQRNRLFQKDVLSRLEAFLGDGIVRGFRRRRNHDRADVRIREQLAVVGGGRSGVGLRGDFLQPLFADFRDMQLADVGAGGTRLGADASAPANSYDGYVDLLHRGLPAVQCRLVARA